MTSRPKHEEQYRQFVQRIDTLLSEGKAQDAVQCANKNFRKLSDEERLHMFELFTRPGLRFSEKAKEMGAKIARKILEGGDRMEWSTRMRAKGLLRMLGGTSEEDMRIVVEEETEKVQNNVRNLLEGDISPQEKPWVAAAAAPLMENGEEAATCIRAINEAGNAILIRDVVIPTVRKTLPNNAGIALLKQALEKLYELWQRACATRERKAIVKIYQQCERLHDALVPYVKEQLEDIQKIKKEMDGTLHTMKDISDEHTKRTYMRTLEMMYKELEKKDRHNISTREWARISHNMSVAAGWAGMTGDAKSYTANAVLALGTQSGQKGDKLAEQIEKQQKRYGLKQMGKRI